MDAAIISILCMLIVATLISFIRSLQRTGKVYVGDKYRQIDDDFFITELEKTAKQNGSVYKKVFESMTGIIVLKKIIKAAGIDLEAIERSIHEARLEDKFTSIHVATMRIFGLLLVAVFGILAVLSNEMLYFLIGLAMFLFFYAHPNSVIKETIKKRRKAIEHELPAFVERVQMCLIGGAQIFDAIAFVAESTPGVLSEEIMDAIREQAYNVNFLEGTLERKAEELNVPEFSSFISNVLIAKTRGVPISGILENEVEKMHRLLFAQIDEVVGKVEARAISYQFLGGMIPALALAIIPAMLTFLQSM